MREDRDLLDDVLDRALALRGHGEPRPGLESRVLATLRSRPRLPWWRALLANRPAWVAAGAVAAAFGLAALFLLQRPRTAEIGTPAVASVPARNARPAAAGAPSPSTIPAAVEPLAGPTRTRAATRLVSTTRTPRRTSFPERRPLSEQERLLLRYVSEAPREEVERRAGFLDSPAPLPALPDPATES